MARRTGNRSISQQTIARELGVSQSLVSIVLNGRREGIAEDTYDRIWNYAIDHGYSPKGMKIDAIGSKAAGVKTAGYFLRAPLKLATKSNFFSHVHQGMHEYLTEHQIHTVFLGSESDFDARNLDKVAWQVKSLCGTVIMGEVHPAFLAAVRKLGKPVVYISARSPGACDSVTANESQAAEQLVEHLCGLGHREFAFLGGMCARSRNEERRTGLVASLETHGCSLRDSCVVEMSDAERMHGWQGCETLLQRQPKPFPTALVCVNGLQARGVISCLAHRGIYAGKDISVVAFDQTRVCTEEYPGITSASSVPEELGRAAARILLERADNPSHTFADHVLPSELSVRESSGPAPAPGVLDQLVGRALQQTS